MKNWVKFVITSAIVIIVIFVVGIRLYILFGKIAQFEDIPDLNCSVNLDELIKSVDDCMPSNGSGCYQYTIFGMTEAVYYDLEITGKIEGNCSVTYHTHSDFWFSKAWERIIKSQGSEIDESKNSLILPKKNFDYKCLFSPESFSETLNVFNNNQGSYWYPTSCEVNPIPTMDGGTECTDSSQCEVFCLVETDSSTKGICSYERSSVGLNRILADGIVHRIAFNNGTGSGKMTLG